MATGLKVVASSSAGMNNSFEQTIGLMTAITEQTKNASKASRGLNSIMANLAQVLDDASSNGKKITEIFKQLGVEMYENGQLKSGYDLLAGLAEKWNTLDNNSQKYIATTIAGTTQLNNFLALMNNFDHAVGATNKALESQGSAMRENDAYMESIQAKLSQLQSTFQDFANNVINSDLAKAVLDLANGLLQIANTDLGQIVTQIVLLTGLGWGATSLTKALGIFKVGIEQFKNLAGVITGVGAAGSITLPIILGIASVLAVGGALWKATEDSRKSFEELKTEIGDTNDKLQTNKERLKEINNLPWNERTQEILNEKDALEQENNELQTQIDKLTELEKKKAKQTLKRTGGYVGTGETEYHLTSLGESWGGAEALGLTGRTFKTYDELVKYLDNYIPGASKKTRQELEALGIEFEAVEGKVYKTGEAYEQDLIQQANELSNKLKTNHQLTDEDLEQYNEVTSKLGTLAQAHQLVGDESTAARDALNGLNSSYKNATEYTQKYGEASTESSRKVTDLVNSLATAASQSGKTEAAFYQLVAAEKVFNNTSLNVAEKISALQQLAAQAGITATLLTASSTATHDQMSGYIRTQKMKGMSESQATQSYLQSIYKEFMSFTPTVPTSLKPPGGGGTKTGTKTTKKDTILENYKERVNVLKSELALMQERGDNEDAQVAKMRQIQDALHQQAEYMRKVGSSEADINALSQEHWQYTKKINELYKQRLETQKELAETQKDELNAQKEQADKEYQLISKYAQHVADEQIALLDKQIEALEQVNDELDKQAQKEKYLQDLATAKSKRLYVFKDGRFQYVEDVDAVSQAESELAEYEREQALESQKESLESQKKMWEDYKDGWSNLTDEYEIEQGRLLYLQKYGASIEQQTWNTRLSNLASFKSSYLKQIEEIEAALAKLQALQAALDAKQWAISGQDWKPGYNTGVNVSASGINKDYVDVLGYDPTTDYSALKKEQGYLTPEQEQQRQNKINDMYGGKDPYQGSSSSGGSSGSSSSSGGSKHSVSQMRDEVNAALEKSKQTGQKVSLGGGVSIDYSKINKHAEGTLGTPGGLSLVGEQGPELRVLGQGDGVLPADITRNLWDWGKINPNNIGGNTTHIFNIDNLTLPNANDAKSLVAGLKNLAYQRAYKRA